MDDTIAAIATAAGRGGVGIVRISGQKAFTIAKKILEKYPGQVRTACYTKFKDVNNKIIDQGVAILFKAPSSFTGEDVVELHGHGGQIILNKLLQQVLQHGARMARAGEFTERAFLNNKIDLVQAEAISELINAQTEQAAKAAMRSLQGDFSKEIEELSEKIINLRLYVEAAIDFPEEEIDFLSDKHIIKKLKIILQQIQKLLLKTKKGALLATGVDVVIAGPPNAGKSSLLNQLTGQESAIVTPIAGTTRDKVSVEVNLDGLLVKFTDTAGIRETSDMVEQAGIARTNQAIANADLVLYLVDIEKVEKDFFEDLQVNSIVVYNKIDLKENLVFANANEEKVFISAKTGEGIDNLSMKIKKFFDFSHKTESAFIARSRHVEALNGCYKSLLVANKQAAGELLAEELRLAHGFLCEITGEFSQDDLLGEIFSSFCIGK